MGGMRDKIKAIHEELESDDGKENKGTVRLFRDLGAGGRVGGMRDKIKAIHEELENDNSKENKGTV